MLLAEPGAFSAAASRAGAGSLGQIGGLGLASWLLKLGALLGFKGFGPLSDAPRREKARWLPVVLLGERNADGSAWGLALTTRTGKLLGDYGELPEFMSRPLHWGGPQEAPLIMVHPYAEVTGARPIGTSGLFAGGDLASAMKWVSEGQGSSLRFRFFLGRIEWGPGELDRELEAGRWRPLQCADDCVLDETHGENLRGPSLWAELAKTAGGAAADAGREYDLLD